VKRARLVACQQRDSRIEDCSCDRHDRPTLTASFSTVSTPGQENTCTEGTDIPTVLPVADAVTGSNKSAFPTVHQNPTIDEYL
jgi:hypothetical protein